MKIIEDLKYLFSKINWADSCLDARSIEIMNSITGDIENLAKGSLSAIDVNTENDEDDNFTVFGITPEQAKCVEDFLMNEMERFDVGEMSGSIKLNNLIRVRFKGFDKMRDYAFFYTGVKISYDRMVENPLVEIHPDAFNI